MPVFHIFDYNNIGIARSADTSGNKFCIAFFRNDPGSSSSTPPTSELLIYVSTPGSTAVDFVIKRVGNLIVKSATVNPGEIMNLTISPSTDFESLSSSVGKKAIVIETINTNDSLHVFGYNDNLDSADVFLAVPIRRVTGIQSYDYAQFSTSRDGKDSTFAVAVCDVEVGGQQEITYFPTVAGSTENVRVFKTQRSAVLADKLDGTVQTGLVNYDAPIVSSRIDLTGFRLSTSIPSGVTIGHQCGQIPFDIETCDYMIEQCPPSYTWGYNFITSGLMPRTTGYIIKIIPRYVNEVTTVTSFCDGDTEVAIAVVDRDGITMDSEIPRNCYFQTSRPAAIVQFSKGQQSDDNNRTIELNIGDPSMAWVPPVGQYLNRFTFFTGLSTATYGSYTFGEFINVIVPLEFFNSSMIKLDGSAISADSWSEVSCSPGELCAYASTLQMTDGKHLLEHDNPNGRLSLLIYGFAREKGYMYPGGFAMDPIGGMYSVHYYFINYYNLYYNHYLNHFFLIRNCVFTSSNKSICS